MKLLAGILLALVCGLSLAADTRLLPTSFAKGITLTIDGREAVYRFDLPESVYHTAVYHNLSDLRIFNQQQVVVPYQIRHKETTRKDTHIKALAFFPVTGPLDTRSRQVKVVTNAQGAIVNINEKAKANKTTSSYLIDASQLAQSPSVLAFDWDDTNDNNLLRKVTIDISNDLVNWQTVVKASTLASLNFAGQHLRQREVNLPAHKAKYYRVSWQEKDRNWKIGKIEARFSSVTSDIKRRWRKSSGVHISDNRFYEFNTGGWWPIDRLRLTMPETNTVAQLILRSRRNTESHWQERYRGLVFDLKLNGQRLQSQEIELPVVTDRHWQLELVGDVRMASGRVPIIDFGWLPYQVVFVAQGDGPFTLGYGAAAVKERGPGIQGLMQKLNKELGNIKPAVLGQTVNLGGDDKLGQPEKPFAWQTWLLWLLMLSGVALLAVMAMNLYRQMNEK